MMSTTPETTSNANAEQQAPAVAAESATPAVKKTRSKKADLLAAALKAKAISTGGVVQAAQAPTLVAALAPAPAPEVVAAPASVMEPDTVSTPAQDSVDEEARPDPEVGEFDGSPVHDQAQLDAAPGFGPDTGAHDLLPNHQVVSGTDPDVQDAPAAPAVVSEETRPVASRVGSPFDRPIHSVQPLLAPAAQPARSTSPTPSATAPVAANPAGANPPGAPKASPFAAPVRPPAATDPVSANPFSSQMAARAAARIAEEAEVRERKAQMAGAQPGGRGSDRPTEARPERARDPVWDCDDTPPGSAFSLQEWQQARVDAEGQAGGPVVLIEIRNRAQSAFISVLREPQLKAAMKMHPTLKKMVLMPVIPPGGVGSPPPGAFDATLSDMLDGCLLLAPSASTAYPRSVTGKIKFDSHDKVFGEMLYRVVRPEAQKLTDQSIYFSMSGTLSLSGGVGAGEDTSEDAADDVSRDRPRARG